MATRRRHFPVAAQDDASDVNVGCAGEAHILMSSFDAAAFWRGNPPPDNMISVVERRLVENTSTPDLLPPVVAAVIRNLYVSVESI